MSALLNGESLSVSYGGVHAVIDLDLSVQPGEIAGLIGPNGAGKTSLIDGLSGFTPMSGRATFKGVDLSGRRPHQRADLGLLRTWQSVKLFDDLTVLENLQVPAARSTWRELARDIIAPRSSLAPKAAAALELLGIAHLAQRLPTECSHGQRVLVGVARALAAEPDLILMDEPGAGLDVGESRVLAGRLRDIAANGTAILLVDHDMNLVLDVSDTISVLDFGRLIARGAPHEVVRDPAVLTAYLGDAEEPSEAPEPLVQAPQ